MIWGLRIGLVVALGLFVSTQIDPSAVSQYFTPALLMALLASQPAILLAFCLFALRLRLIAPEPAPKPVIAFNAFVLPIGLNAVLPVRLSELVKPAYLRWATGLALRNGLSIIAVEKVFDVLVIGAMAIFIMPTAYLSSGVLAVLLLVITGAAILPWLVNSLVLALPQADNRFLSLIRPFLEAIIQVNRRNQYIAVLILTAGGWMASMLSVFIFLNLAGTRTISFVEAGAVFVLTLIGGLVAVLPAGLGAFQAAAIIGLMGIGYSQEESLVLAILLHVQALLLAGVYAAAFASCTNFRFSQIKKFDDTTMTEMLLPYVKIRNISAETKAAFPGDGMKRLIPALMLICLLALLFRAYLDNSGEYLTQIYLERFYQGYMTRLMAEKPFWYFLLPMPEIKGVWATTGFVMIYFMEVSVGPHATFLILTTCATAAFGFGTWLILRRVLPSGIAAAALAFSPFNYSVYLWNGSNNCYATIAFLAIAFGFFGAYVLHEGRRTQFILGMLFLALGALSYESWLDAAAIFVVLTPFIVIFCRRFGYAEIAHRYKQVFIGVITFAIFYTAVRLSTIHNTAIPGMEFQMIWNHASFGPMFDDLIFNAVFMVYASVAQLLPGFVGTSLAINEAGQLDVAALQHGYQPNLYPVVASHYLNLWLMYAGALVAGLLVGSFVWLRRALTQGSIGALIAGLLSLAILVGSPTHTILEFVAFNGVAFYSYKVTIGLMVLFLALAFAVDAIDRRLHMPKRRIALVTFIFAYLLLVAFTRPHWANENVREIWGEVGFFANGFYPDPWQNLKARLGMDS